MTAFITGVLVAGYLTAALFFLRFWRQTADRLFLLFSVAFALLALQRGALLALAGLGPGAAWLYALRLLAFLLILAAIVDKNRSSR